jgi:hypothetical protein
MWGLMWAEATPLITVTPLMFIIGRHLRRAMDGGAHHLPRVDGIGTIRHRIGIERLALGINGIIVGPMTGMTAGRVRR